MQRAKKYRWLMAMALVACLTSAAGIAQASPVRSSATAETFRWRAAGGAGLDDLGGVSIVSPSRAYAVGNDTAQHKGVIYRYDGSSWSRDSYYPTELTAVSALPNGQAWAVGRSGRIFFCDGFTWIEQSSGVSEDLFGVTACDPRHAWAAGASGTILYFDGASWTVQQSATSSTLQGIFALDTRHVWAVGTSGTVVFFNGSSWAQQQSNSSSDLNSIVALDDNNAWACGKSSTMLRLDVRGWRPVSLPAPGDLDSLTALDPDHVWCCGTGGAVFFNDGSEWSLQKTNSLEELRAVTALDTANVWAVGSRGTLLQGKATGQADCSKFYFAEGSCRPGFFPYLCIQVPGASPAHVKLTFMKGAGGVKIFEYDMKALCRTTIDVKSLLGEGDDAAHDFSVQVDSSVPIIAERPIYFAFAAWKGGHDVIGASHPAPCFYFAEGTCRPGYASYICVQNPGLTPTHVAITYMLGDATNRRQELDIGAQSRSTVAVNDVLHTGDDVAHDFSAKVETTDGSTIVAERPMYFSYRQGWPGYGWIGGHDVVGALAPARSYYFAEGTCRPGFEPYICIQNPGAVAAQVTVTLMQGTGEKRTFDIEVKERSRRTLSLRDVLGQADDKAHDFSIKAECTNGQRIIVERPMYFCYKQTNPSYGWTGGHDVVGATRAAQTYYFAEGSCRPGFEPYLCVQNPGEQEATVHVTFMLGDGTNRNQDLKVPARSRYTVTVRDLLGSRDDASSDFSAQLTADGSAEIICERPMYFAFRSTITGGHDVVGYAP